MTKLSLAAYAIRLARAAAERSEDPFHKVGCVLVRHDKTVASIGYNGAVPGVEIDWSDRDARRVRVVHAEANALRYVTPGTVMFAASTMMPCADCVKLIASYGIKLVVYADELDASVYPVALTMFLAEELGVELVKEEAG